MRNFLLTLLFLVSLSPLYAGNKLGTQPTLDSEGFSSGERLPYLITENQEILFDGDINEQLINETVEQINSELVDIKLETTFSNVDYEHATELFSFSPVKFQKRFEPNRIFVFLGRGFVNEFFASVRVYEDTEQPTCFIGLDKNFWDVAPYSTQKEILTHEIFHCLGWAHPSNNPYVNNSDFVSNDNIEVLHRLHDANNVKDRTTIKIESYNGSTIGFIAPKKVREARSTYTVDGEVKLVKGSYKIQLDDRYIRNITKNGKIKYTRKLKKAKKFNFSKCDVRTLDLTGGQSE